MEGIQTRQLDIAGGTLCVTQLPPMRGFRLLARLGRVTTPAFARLAALGDHLEDNILEHGNVFGAAAQALFANLDEDTLESITMELFASAELLRDGKIALGTRAGFNKAFTTDKGVDYKAMMEAVGFALKVNFADFIGDVLGKLRAAFEEMKDAAPDTSNPQSDSSSAGPSGESG